MFVDALTALAHDPAVGLVAIDAFPPRLEGETPWADPVLRRAHELRRETGVVFASVCMSPLSYGDEARDFTRRWRRMPFLQGHRAAAGAMRALLDHQEVPRRVRHARWRRTANATAARRALRGLEGPVDEAVAARILARYGVRRPREAAVRTPEEAAAFAARVRGVRSR